MRPLLLVVLGLALLGIGLVLGRLSVAPDLGFRPGSLPGDDALEQAWENFLQSQRAALLLLRNSEFYGDDQERAEAYFVLLQDIEAALAVARVETSGPLLGRLPASQADGIPLTPNGMAGMLEGAAENIYQRSHHRLSRVRQAFESARNGIALVETEGDMQVGLGHWDLDNNQALLIELPADGMELSLGNVWAMGLWNTTADGTALACNAEAGCRGILSHRDPELDGWLDTGGHRRGLLLLRWPSGEQAPAARLVPFATLKAAAAQQSHEPVRQGEETP